MRRLGLLLMVTLAACGSETPPDDSTGAGGDAGMGSTDGGRPSRPDVGPPVSPQSPTVVRTTPSPGALTSDRPVVQFVFSEAMAPEAADAVTATVEGEPVMTNALVTGARLDVGFQGRLPGTSSVTVTVAAGARALGGGALQAAFSLSFGVRGTAPIPPVLATDLSPRSLEPCAAPSPALAQGMNRLADGLAEFGWSFSSLHSPVAWGVPVEAVTRWINDGARAEGVRIEVESVPRVDDCFVGALAGASSDEVLSVQGAYADGLAAFDELTRPADPAGDYPADLIVDFPLTSALWGLFEQRPGDEAFTDALRSELERFEAKLDMETRRAFADLIHALGEAELLREAALGERASELRAAAELVTEMNLLRGVTTTGRWIVEPEAPLARLRRDDTLSSFEGRFISMAALRVAAAAERLIAQLQQAEPRVDGPLDIDTPIGRFVLHLQAEANEHRLDGDVALFIDAGGDDHYAGSVAANIDPKVAAALVIDLEGDDRYGPDGFELTNSEFPLEEAVASAAGFSQGFGLLGVGMLYDLEGDDLYRGTSLVQGVGFLGVGALIDRAGDDRYDGTFVAQGAGQFGTGLLLDEEGADTYVTFHNGQGVGRPGGQGLLLDRGGADEYLAVYIGHTEELPEEGRLLFPGGGIVDGRGTGYFHTAEDGSVRVHNLSGAQGTGWGFRFDWFPEGAPTALVWAGGFGALVDEGEDPDLHFADTLSIGQGFVYGLGLMHDGGGDDLYRAFWWAFGSGTHMGTGLFRDRGGDDDLMVTRFSAALGHDTGVSWFIDDGGSDIYRGNITHGRSLDEGQAFFMDLGGVDFYQSPLSINYGVCNHSYDSPIPGVARAGLFLDAGDSEDFYETAGGAARNNATWRQSPAGAGAAPETSKRGWGSDGP